VCITDAEKYDEEVFEVGDMLSNPDASESDCASILSMTDGDGPPDPRSEDEDFRPDEDDSEAGESGSDSGEGDDSEEEEEWLDSDDEEVISGKVTKPYQEVDESEDKHRHLAVDLTEPDERLLSLASYDPVAEAIAGIRLTGAYAAGPSMNMLCGVTSTAQFSRAPALMSSTANMQEKAEEDDQQREAKGQNEDDEDEEEEEDQEGDESDEEDEAMSASEGEASFPLPDTAMIEEAPVPNASVIDDALDGPLLSAQTSPPHSFM
jgi:hypothetical protein